LDGYAGRDYHDGVTTEPQDSPTDVRPFDPRAQMLSMQGLLNRFVRGMLRTPGISRGIGKRLITLYVVGRKSGRRYAVPVTYARDGADLVIGTPFAWGRNLRTGEPVDIRLRGRRRPADVRVFTDEAAVAEHYALIARDNRNFATFNRIGLDETGEPIAADLRAVWAAGGRAFRLTPR
jgi:deazaflavin-dependent oxidoreductase (nitroreductase family)